MRFAKNRARPEGRRREGPLTIGYVPTMDCATLVAAQELGLFRRQGLEVMLSREVGWATVREKLLHGELEGAVAHASLLFSIYFGLGCVRRPCLTGLMLGHHGSAITVSRELWSRGVRDAATLAPVARENGRRRPVTLGIVLEFSVQHVVLDAWLRSAGLAPGEDVRLTVVPSGLVHRSLQAGHIDGYCVAEPWSSMAALSGDGVVLHATGELSAGHPDKALVVLQEFADERADEHERLLAALLEASQFCADPANRGELARWLSAPAYLDVPEAALRNSLIGPYDTGAGARDAGDWVRFDAATAGAPDRAHGRWVLDAMLRLADEPRRALLRPGAIPRIFREDLYAAAVRRCGLEAGGPANGRGPRPSAESPNPARRGPGPARSGRSPGAGRPASASSSLSPSPASPASVTSPTQVPGVPVATGGDRAWARMVESTAILA